MSHYEIDEERLQSLRDFAARSDAPVTMVNLMRFRERAEYPPDSEATPCSGRKAMKRYQDVSAGVRRASGARLVWAGRVAFMAIAPTTESWDSVVLVEYPSAQAYLTMRATAEYQAARFHRRAALLDSRLIMSLSVGGPEL